jgi:hypothetical protein
VGETRPRVDGGCFGLLSLSSLFILCLFPCSVLWGSSWGQVEVHMWTPRAGSLAHARLCERCTDCTNCESYY